jgi:hypothetical protein
MKWIFEKLDFITEIELVSDKCGKKELEKLDEDYKKDLKKGVKKTKAKLSRYIKEDTMEPDSEEEEKNKDKKGAKDEKKGMEIVDTTVSQNPKSNIKIAEGFGLQMTNSRVLLTFKLVHFRLSPHSWQEMGQGMRNARSLRVLSLRGTNLNQGENIKNLLKGMQKNTSIEILDLSDNDLRDEQGAHLLVYIKKLSERRDDLRWWKSLR